jgi:exodeoxyribonuclease V alpha subunit
MDRGAVEGVAAGGQLRARGRAHRAGVRVTAALVARGSAGAQERGDEQREAHGASRSCETRAKRLGELLSADVSRVGDSNLAMAGAGEPELTLDGTVERIVFHAADTSFTVARLVTSGHEHVTIVGALFDVKEGMPLRLTGQWTVDKKWGRRFKVASYRLSSPRDLVGIERFLGSSSFKGIGPELAKRLVKQFGLETIHVIEKSPERLTEVPGIGEARAKKIADVYATQRHIENIMVTLRGHDVTEGEANRIYKRYGNDAINVVKQNPYRLAREVNGIGFHKADRIAQSMGLGRDAPERIEAGILYALQTAGEDGHVHVPDEELLRATAELLGVAVDAITPRLGALEQRQLVVRESLGMKGPCTSLPWAYEAEQQAATLLAELVRTPPRSMLAEVDAAIQLFEQQAAIALATQQRAAVAAALRDKLVVITGGPGVGKTTIVKAIVQLARIGHKRVALAAPTGRAAKRLAEATGQEAMTIHRLLEYAPHEGGFQRDREEPLDADMLIVDEASMVDIQLFRSLLEALRPGAQLVLVGDIDQLPSVGAGAVLDDVIASEAATVIRLTEIFRQAAASKIVVSAHRINHGELPELAPPADSVLSDFYFIQRDEPEAAREAIIALVAERIPQRFGFDPVEQVQVLAPMHRGELGTAALNRALQERLNPPGGAPELVRGERVYRRGDKVMQLKNDYDKGVFNGDIGLVLSIDTQEGVMRVDYDGRIASYERQELDQLQHAYAVSIHKSQGSEYPAVVIPLATQHFMMLQRSLLYTAVTRGKQLVVIVGSRRAVALAVRNADAKRRHTWLAERVRAALA